MACLALDIKQTAPSFRNIGSLQLVNWITNTEDKLDTTKIKEFKVECHKITWGNKLSNSDIAAIYTSSN